MRPYPGEFHQCLLIRRNPQHAVVAHVSWLPGKFRLLRLTADKGAIPDASHLIESRYSTRSELRTAVLKLMASSAPRQLDLPLTGGGAR